MARPLRQQIYLGDERFIERMQALADPRSKSGPDVPKAQRQRVRPLAKWLASREAREDTLYRGHTAGSISMTAIVCELGLSVSRVGRLNPREEGQKARPDPEA